MEVYKINFINKFLVFIGLSMLSFVELWIALSTYQQYGIVWTILWIICSVAVFVVFIKYNKNKE